MEQYAGVLEAAPGDPLTLGDLASDDAGDDGPWHD
jgi:hypothetical protein